MSNVDMSEQKREWHSRKHERKTRFHLWWFLACISLLLKFVVSKKCASIYPESEVYVVIGKPVDLFCVSNGNFSADYLEFRWQGKVLKSTKVNETTIKLVDTPKPLPGKNRVTYSCKTNYTNCEGEKNTSKFVYASLPPKKVKDFQCISDNFETLNCSWISTDNIETNYEVSFLDYRGKLQNQSATKNNNTDDSKRYCYWTLETKPPYRRDAKEFTILIVSNNTLGIRNETKNITDHFSIVKPAAVKNLSKLKASPQHVELQWEVHDNLVITHFGEYVYKIICDLGKSNESKYIKTVQHYSKNLSIHNKVVTFNLTELPYAYMRYRVRVYIKPDNASENFWSEPSEIYVNTSSEIPRRPPDVALGSFHQTIFELDRQIQIYWKELEKNEEAGPNFSYNISIKHKHGQKFYKTTGGFLRVNNAPKDDINILIWAENEVGKSINASSLYIPFKSTQQVTSLTKHTYNNGTNKLSWVGLHNVNNYTIFWCPYIVKNNCTNRLNYTVVGIHEKNFIITLPNNILYQFAISANYPEATNGMTWTVCETYEDSNLPSNFDVKFTGNSNKTSVELHWSHNCILEEGYLKGYIIGYCPKGIPSSDCNNNESTNSTEQHKLIRGLKPYTTYVFTIKLVTVSGIKPINKKNDILTLPDTPTSPRNIYISTVLNDSLVINFDPPYPLNGDKHDILYKIYDGNNDLLKSSFIIPITVSNLNGFTNYSLYLQACNEKIEKCSNKSDEIFVRTRIGRPERLETPTCATKTNNKFECKWKEPKMRGGNVDFYQINVTKDSKHEIFNVTKRLDAEFELCDEGYNNVDFKVRAVNNDSDAHHGALGDSDRVFLPIQNHSAFTLFHGEWSMERPINCHRSADLTVLYPFAIMLSIVLFILLVYLVRRRYLIMQAKKDIYPIFPQGLYPSNPSNVIVAPTVNENRSILNKIWLLLCKRSQIRVNQFTQQTSVDSNKPLMSQDNILEESIISKNPLTISITTECLGSNQNTPTISTYGEVAPCIKFHIQSSPDSITKPNSISNIIAEMKDSEKTELHLNGSEIIAPVTTNKEDDVLRNKFEVPKSVVNPQTGYVQTSFTNTPKTMKPVANAQKKEDNILRNKFEDSQPIVNPKTGYVQSSFTNAFKSLKPVANTQNKEDNEVPKPIVNPKTGYVHSSFTNAFKSLKPVANTQNKGDNEVPKPIVNPKTGYVHSSFTNTSKTMKPVASTQTGYVQIGIVPEINTPDISLISTLYGNIPS